jgi:putative NIF3 family GTP cyclohydrolase 1 type 2
LTLDDIYQFAIEWGINADPRGKDRVKKTLEKTKKEYEGLKPEDQEYFDKERLVNPYSDTRILYGDGKLEVKRILVGIDIEIGEVLLADRLAERGQKIDLIISHHPEGRALAGFYDVMHMQADILNKLGVPINVAEGILKERISEVKRRVMPVNHNRAVDVARLLNIPLMCIHTPADNGVTRFLQDLMDKEQPETVEQVLDKVMELAEFQQAARNNAPPTILVGAKNNRCGKVFVDMTGGTGGSKEAFEKLTKTDVGTVLGMHIGEDHRKEAEKNHINVVIAGHISSDSLGLNLLLDNLMQQEKLEVVCCSGFQRVERAGEN